MECSFPLHGHFDGRALQRLLFVHELNDHGGRGRSGRDRPRGLDGRTNLVQGNVNGLRTRVNLIHG